jgi:integrase
MGWDIMGRMVEDLSDPRRAEPPYLLNERDMLEQWLEFHRTTLLLKCEELDDTGLRHGEPCSLRWIYVHMIEEYARHNGHADLMRELIDGRVGW